MKILMSSHVFWPNLGGLEAVSEILAREFVRFGHKVTLVTQTPSVEKDDVRFSFHITRRPRPWELSRLVKGADVFFHNNISLQTAWPLLFIRKPWIVAHHIWIPVESGVKGLKGRIKQRMLRHATGIAISESIARHLDTPSVVIPNPYDVEMFHELPGVPRTKGLVFVGRLVSDKGLPVLLEALSRLKKRGLAPTTLTVIGKGPEEEAWRRLSKELGLTGQVTFVGVKRGRALVESLNAHKILVVPSLWDEPFGIVALEGIACGCVVVGSGGGGLKDAIGPCGMTFPNGDVDALAACLLEMLCNPEHAKRYRAAASAHLARHRPDTVAKRYLEVFTDTIQQVNYVGAR